MVKAFSMVAPAELVARTRMLKEVLAGSRRVAVTRVLPLTIAKRALSWLPGPGTRLKGTTSVKTGNTADRVPTTVPAGAPRGTVLLLSVMSLAVPNTSKRNTSVWKLKSWGTRLGAVLWR